jgi:hypothetical protein
MVASFGQISVCRFFLTAVTVYPWRDAMVRSHVLALSLLFSLAAGWVFVNPTALRADSNDAQSPRPWVIYLLPHSHVDIGYTHLQPEVEQKQWQNIELALALCKKTADYPPEARFKWNTEVLWAVDSYLRQASPEKQQALVDAIRAGQVELDGLYGNELTGLCRPEELLRLMERGTAIAKRCGVKIDSAMISDVPGYTWGIVPAMAQAGIKYFSIGPNLADRIGRVLSTWEDKPFYWLAPDGKQKVLCWIPYKGYAVGHPGIHFDWDKEIPAHLARLEKKGYPYDIVQLRWNVGGDNGPPDEKLSDRVKEWNAAHASPKLAIATTSELFQLFEKRYGDKIPAVTGDFTPYWEDGAASSARETAINRTAAERLVQAETLSAMFSPQKYPAAPFSDAWRNVILYDEHTWGAHNSITQPDEPFVKNQWKIKQAFALDADAQSQKLLEGALAERGGDAAAEGNAIDVFNTSAWPRTELVLLSQQQSSVGGAVLDGYGKAVPSQRLSTGELAFLAENVPALAGKRFSITAKAAANAATAAKATAEATTLNTPSISIAVDPSTGIITSLKSKIANADLSDAQSGIGLNRYDYVLAERVKEAQTSGPAKVAVKENGPLVASLIVESDAPGCVNFRREIRVVAGLDRIDLINTLDKKAIREKEGVHLGFAFNVPGGTMRMDVPWAVVRPELDQMPGSCKNWFTVGRWVDVSNADYGVTWSTLDAPLAEVGAITANIMGPLPKPEEWLGKLEPSQTLYSWVMNNHWYTNYRADQDGPTTFRYAMLPHKQYDPVAAQRFGIECSQPLVVAAARGAAPSASPLVTVDAPNVLVASVKPSNDGGAWMVRLFEVAGKAAKIHLQWGKAAPKAVWLSNLAEEPVTAVTGAVEMPANGLVTLRADLP